MGPLLAERVTVKADLNPWSSLGPRKCRHHGRQGDGHSAPSQDWPMPSRRSRSVCAGLLLYGLQTGYAYTRASALPYDSGAMLFGTGLMLTASDEYSIHAYDSRLP